MKKNYYGRKITSILLVIAMMMGLVQSAFAAEIYQTPPEYSDLKADLSFEYIGTSPAGADLTLGDYMGDEARDELIGAIPTNSNISEFKWEQNGYVWIGMYVEHMDRIQSMFPAGLTNLTATLVYDKNYLSYTQTDLSNGFSYLDGTQDYYFDNLNTATYPYTSGKRKPEPHYDTNAKAPTTIQESYAHLTQEFSKVYPISLTETDYSDLGVSQQSIKFNGANDQRIFAGDYMKPDKTLVAVFPMTMSSASAPAPGTKIVQGFLGASTFVINVDAVSYNYLYSDEEPDTNLSYKFNVVNDVVNLFPGKVEVTYNAGRGTWTNDDTAVKTEQVAENGNPTLKYDSDDDGSLDREISSQLTPPAGETFKGWYTDPAHLGDSAYEFTASSSIGTTPITVYAYYEAGYKINFKPNGATWADGTNTDKNIIGSVNTAPLGSTETIASKVGTVTKADAKFVDWYTKNDDGSFAEKYDDNKLKEAIDKAITIDLYPRWDRTTPGKFTLNFNKNSTNATDASPTSVTFNEEESLNDILGGMPVPPSRSDNYKFAGWYLTPSGDGTKLESNTALGTYVGANADTTEYTVYARWDYVNVLGPTESDIQKYDDTITVKFNTDNLTYKYGTIANKHVKPGDKIDNLPNPADISYTGGGKGFGGWYTQPDDKGTVVTEETVINTSLDGYNSVDKEITLYPKWIDEVTVSYDLNGLSDTFGGIATAPTEQKGLPNDDFVVANPTLAQDYTITEWNTKSDGTGDSYKPGEKKQIPNSNTKLYAIWSYEGQDAVTVTFHGNGTKQYPATLTPKTTTGETEDTYVVKRPNGYSITVAQQPTATRNKYIFKNYATTATAAATTQEPIAVTDTSTDSSKTMNLYAIWQADPTQNPVTVHVHMNNSGFDTDPARDYDVTVAVGDSLGVLLPTPTVTTQGYAFDKWVSGSADSQTEFTKDTVVNADTDVYAKWSQDIEISFDLNDGTIEGEGTIDSVTIKAGESLGSKFPANPTRDGYTFDGWYYTHPVDKTLTKVESDTVLNSSLTLKAKFTANVNLTFTNDKYEYNADAQTPMVDGNYTVTMNIGDDDVTNMFGVDDFTVKYYASSADKNSNSNALSGAPTDAGEYHMTITLTPATTDLYTVYQLQNYKDTFTIEPKPIDLVLDKNYQYVADESGITAITLTEKTGTSGINLGNGNIFASDSDVEIKFKKVDESASTTARDNAEIVGQMPTEFGEYTIVFNEKQGHNFKPGNITNATQGGVTNRLYLYSTQRVVNFDVTTNGGNATPGGSLQKTVTIPAPSNVIQPESTKSSIKEQTSPNNTLPVEDTDFTPPAGKTLDKWIVEASTSQTAINPFTAESNIGLAHTPLTVVAVYKDAEWKINFKDTKVSFGGVNDADVVYTMDAGKSVSEGGVKKVNGGDVTDPVNELHEPDKAPDNYMFYGWTKDKSYAETSGLKKAEIDSTKILTTANKPDDGYIDANTSEIDVYAVYVLSDDASLGENGIVFKETDENGLNINFVKNDFKTPVEFDDKEDTYYLIASNAIANGNAYYEIKPTNPGSTVKVTFNSQDQTTTTGTVGKLSVADNKSTNTITVEVTAPDGTTKKEYTFEILVKAVPMIKLGYGNSPAGLIYRMGEKVTNKWSEDRIERALNEFNNGGEYIQDNPGKINKTYGADNVPDNGDATLKYVDEAWREYIDEDGNIINYDLDPYSLFVYQGSTFKAPKYDIIDELGQKIQNAEAEVKFEIKRQTSVGVSKYKDDLNNKLTDEQAGVTTYSPALVDNTKDTYDLRNIMVRMDVYSMDYSYEYTKLDGSTEPLSVKRPTIVLSKRGDIYLNSTPTINDGDVDYLRDHAQFVNSKLPLISYRCMDFVLNATPTINDGDVDYLRDHTQEINGTTQQYYKNID